VNKSTIKEYFERLANDWEQWENKNPFYHARITHLIGGMVPPASQVLELGSGTGNLLAFLKPSHGVGLNVGQGLTNLARQKHPELEFHTIDVDSASPPGIRSTVRRDD
jgi:ubiquinone/menaquinone biosynthesis C-methylase UbiE